MEAPGKSCLSGTLQEKPCIEQALRNEWALQEQEVSNATNKITSKLLQESTWASRASTYQSIFLFVYKGPAPGMPVENQCSTRLHQFGPPEGDPLLQSVYSQALLHP